MSHSDQSVINSKIAMRVVFLKDFANDGGAFVVLRRWSHPLLVHSVDNSPLDRFQPIADVGQGAGDDDAHRVIEVRLLHLVGDGDGENFSLFGLLFLIWFFWHNFSVRNSLR